MTAPSTIDTGLYAKPYDWQDPENLENNVLLLDEFETHPAFVTAPVSAAERRLAGAAILANPQNRIWGVWRGEKLLGVLVLTRVLGETDALFHFMFLDGNLVGKRTLLTRFLGYCFTVLNFRRISAEVPEDADRLIDFYRDTLGFMYEGETRAARHYPVASATPQRSGSDIPRPAKTIAKLGSRVDGMYWRNDRWIDVLRLRLFRGEWELRNADSTNRSSRSAYRGRVDRESGRPEVAHHHPPATG